MKVFRLRTKTIPKLAMLATTALVGGLFVATVDMAPAAQAYPSRNAACTNCHAAGGSVTATPSTATPASGAAYTVAIAITSTATGSSGYWISTEAGASVLSGGPAAGTSHQAAMTAPAAAGSYTYKVWADQGGTGDGQAASTTFTITVGSTTPTPTATTPEPTATLPEPTATLPEPTATLPEPTATLPEPTATLPEPTATVPEPTATVPAVTGERDMSPTGALGMSHLSMYNGYGSTCVACHDGLGQPKPPPIAIDMADMAKGISCSACHGPGKGESDEPLFISQMNDSAKKVYSRCSDCHTIAPDGGDSDDDSDDDDSDDDDSDDDDSDDDEREGWGERDSE